MTLMPRRYPTIGSLSNAIRGPEFALNCDDAVCNNNDYARAVFDDAAAPGPLGSVAAKEAKRICRACPIIAECRAYALRNAEPWGVWGGMTLAERERAIVQIQVARSEASLRRRLAQIEQDADRDLDLEAVSA